MTKISVIDPFFQAITRVGTVLFKPFNPGKWFVIGFCAWLAYLIEGGGFNGGGNFGRHGPGGQTARESVEQARDFIVNNIAWLAPLAIVISLILLAIWLALLWLSSRGHFMFLHCVALNTAEIAVPWRRFAGEANSLFLFRLVISLISFVVFLPLAAGLALVILRMILRETVTPGGILAILAVVLAMAVAGILFWVVARLTRDFVVPLQFLRRIGCLEAWRELAGMLPGNAGNFLLYLLFRVVLGIGMSLLVLVVIVATCCIAGCLLAIPYLGTVLLLPILVFERSYSLKFLAQFGPGFDAFTPPAASLDDRP
jgi:hypothetical protein